MLQTVLARQQQVGRSITRRGGAGQGVTAQLALAHRQQAFRRSAEQHVLVLALPQEPTAASLVAAEAAQQGQGVEGLRQLQLLPHGQHQLLKLLLAHQFQGPLHGGQVVALPGLGGQRCPSPKGVWGRSPGGGIGSEGLAESADPLRLPPEFLGQAAGRHVTAEGTLQP